MIQLINISKQFGEKILYRDASLTIKPSEKVGLVGSNGSGKTTLLNIIAQQISIDSGEIAISKGFRIGVLEQEFHMDENKSVIDEVKDSIFEYGKEIDQLKISIASEKDPQKLKHLMRMYEDLEHKFHTHGGYEIEANCRKILGGLGFSEEMILRKCGYFSGGQRMRIAIAKLLASPLDALMLDEPTNHLDLPSLLWFEEYIKSYEGMVIVISHDRVFLNNIVNKIAEISNQKITTYTGNYDEYVEAKSAYIEKLEATQKNLLKQREKTERFIERFRAKNTKSSQVQSRIKMLEKQIMIDIPEAERTIDFSFPQPERSGYEVIKMNKICKSYGLNIILDDINLSIKRGEKVAIIGKNGTGKSTLVKIMAGIIESDSGTFSLGVNVNVGYFSQVHVEQLDESISIMEEMEKIRGNKAPTDVRKLLGVFFFTGDDVFKKIGLLSGGEKSRVLLARMLLSPSNFLILDEPTNHLDMATQSVLIEALDEFSGTICFVSHDRYLINNVATRMIVFDDNGITDFPGNYDEYTRWKKEEENKSPNQKDKNTNIRKDEKRKEAQERNIKYKYRKEYDDKILHIESELEKLMKEEDSLNKELADTANYKNQEKIKFITERYKTVKEEINCLTTKWEEYSLERERWL